MPDTDFKKFAVLIRDVVRDELKPLKAQVAGLDNKVTGLDNKVTGLDNKVTGLDNKVTGLTEQVASMNEQVVYLTEKVDGEIIPTLEIHTKYLKRLAPNREKNADNIKRLDKRLLETEAKLGIQAPPEFQIIE